MKKKNLKSLLLHKCSVSNLTLLYRKVGGALPPPDTGVQTYVNPNDASADDVNCTTINNSGGIDCPSWAIHNCQTNGGTTRAKPPSEHQGCHAGSEQGSVYNGA